MKLKVVSYDWYARLFSFLKVLILLKDLNFLLKAQKFKKFKKKIKPINHNIDAIQMHY